MGLASTKPTAFAGSSLPILYTTVAAPDATTFCDNLAPLLDAAGWVVTTYAGGYRATAISPQGKEVCLLVRDLGHQISFVWPFTVTFNFETTDAAYRGDDMELPVGAGVEYTAVIGICYIHLLTPGVRDSATGSCLFGGIPFLPAAVQCGGQIVALAADRVWFAFNDFGLAITPRATLITNGTSMTGAQAFWDSQEDGAIYCAPGNALGSLRIAALTPSSQIGNLFNAPSPVLWIGGSTEGGYLVYEPLLCWGLTNTDPPVYRAQMYDAMIFSKQEVMDTEENKSGYAWLEVTDSWIYGTLALIVGLAPTEESQQQKYSFIAT